jgi:hypothetical protein
MSIKSRLSYSPLSQRVYWGKVNQKTGVSSGEQKDVTNEFLQCMELKFPINTSQIITVNGEPKYRVLVVDMEKEVIVNGKLVQSRVKE